MPFNHDVTRRLEQELEGYLPRFLPHAPAALLPNAALAPIAELAARLPACPGGGFECRLGDSAQVDAFLQIDAGWSRQTWARAAAAPEGLLGSAAWQPVRRWLACWNDPRSPLFANVPHAWIEFDFDGRAEQLPSVGIRIGPAQAANAAPLAGMAAERYLEVAAPFLESLLAPAAAAEAHAALARIMPALVEFAVSDCLLSVMLPRQDRHASQVRLLPAGIARARLLDFLRAIDWPGDLGEAGALVAALPPELRDVVLAIGAADGVEPRIGFECYLAHGYLPHQPGWRAFGDALVAAKLCTPEKRDALLAWPGATRVAAPALLPRAHVTYQRFLSHIKVSHVPGAGNDAKAYLIFSNVVGQDG